MDKRNPRSLIYAMALLILCITGAIFVFVFTSINELSLSKFLDRSYVLYSDKGNVLAYTLSSDTSALRFKTTKDEVSKLYINMLIANEDKRFYSHFGVDPFSIVRAAFYNFRNQNVGSGASTLAMQVAKRLTGHKRTYINKVKEMVQAIYLTLKYKRDGILTLYLTLSPFGGNIEGVKAASLTWFNHLPNTLTPSEAALLTAQPRAPEHIRPDKNPKSALYYKNEVLKLANRAFIITKEQLNLSLKEELPHKRFTIRQNALTFGNYVFNLKKSNTKTDFKELDILHTDDKEIFSSLDDTVQDELNLIAAKFEQNSDPNYVLSAIVLDIKSHTIKGVLGSSSNKKTTVCLPFRLRSPGSSLKPFAYAFAMEKGMLHPNTILHDNQNLYGTWSPNNFSRKFCGNISAKKALTYSLNLPALEVLNLVGANSFSKKFNLNEQLLKFRNNKSDLSIVLGSGIINLYNLARLYAMLNEDGLMHEFTYKNKSDINLQKYRLLTKDSARAVFEILKETPRPYLYPEQKLISYKTGTAYEFTDALAIGILNNLTVAVSISSPYNIKGNTHYTGYDSASPYLFEILSKSKTEKLYKEDLNSPLLNTAPPTALKELNLTNQSHALNHEKKLEITFPTNGQTVSPDSHGKVYIKTKGQTGELIITVNNEQFEQHYFEPKSEGFYSITVIDEAGQTDTTKIKVEFR